MKCLKCGKKILQVWGKWSPDEPDITRRGYLCRSCKMGYVEVFSRVSQKVIHIEEKDLSVKRDKQVSLEEWIKNEL